MWSPAPSAPRVPGQGAGAAARSLGEGSTDGPRALSGEHRREQVPYLPPLTCHRPFHSTRVPPEALPETAPVGKVLELLLWPKPGVHHLPQTASAARVSCLTGSCLCSYLAHILHYFRLLERSWPGSPVLKACPLFLSTALP